MPVFELANIQRSLHYGDTAKKHSKRENEVKRITLGKLVISIGEKIKHKLFSEGN